MIVFSAFTDTIIPVHEAVIKAIAAAPIDHRLPITMVESLH